MFGLIGIFLGTTISSIVLPIWIQAKLVYNKLFNKSVSSYFLKYMLYLILTLVSGGICTLLCNNINVSGLIGLIIKGLICLIIPNIIYFIALFRTKELRYIINILKNMLYSKKFNIFTQKA